MRFSQFLASVFFLVAVPAVDAQELTLYTGEQVYERFCSACHGAEAMGDGPVAATLSVPVPNLTTLSQRHDDEFPAAWVRETIDGRSLAMAHGPRYMPVWGYEFWIEEGADILAEEETRMVIARLVNYLRSIQRSQGAIGEPR